MMVELNKREVNMLATFRTKTRFWRGIPETAESLWKKGMIKPTKFGMGNFQITEDGRNYLRKVGE